MQLHISRGDEALPLSPLGVGATLFRSPTLPSGSLATLQFSQMKFEFFNARYNDWQMARRDFCITIGRLLEPNELFTIASEGLQPLADAPVILKQYGYYYYYYYLYYYYYYSHYYYYYTAPYAGFATT